MSGFFAVISTAPRLKGWIAEGACPKQALIIWLQFILRRCLPLALTLWALHPFLSIAPYNQPEKGFYTASDPVTGSWRTHWGQPAYLYFPARPLWYLSVSILFWLVTPPLLFMCHAVSRQEQTGLLFIVLVANQAFPLMIPSDKVVAQPLKQAIYLSAQTHALNYLLGVVFGSWRINGREEVEDIASGRKTYSKLSLITDLAAAATGVACLVVWRTNFLFKWSSYAAHLYAANIPFLIFLFCASRDWCVPSLSIRILSSRWCAKVSPDPVPLMVFILHCTVSSYFTKKPTRESPFGLPTCLVIWMASILGGNWIFKPAKRAVDRSVKYLLGN